MENYNIGKDNGSSEEKKKKKHWIIVVILLLLCISICIMVWKIGIIGYIPVDIGKNISFNKKDDINNQKHDINKPVNNQNNQDNTQNLIEQNDNNGNDESQNYSDTNKTNKVTNSKNNKSNNKSNKNTNSTNQNQENSNDKDETSNGEQNESNEENNIIEAKIEIKQGDLNAELIEDLDIFKNPEFDNQKIIAPSSKGSYDFTVKNLAKNNIVYNIVMTEENDWNINLKYRLKQDNIYIIGNQNTWVDIEQLNVKDLISTNNSEHLYTLEWYWEDADNDTEIGKASNASYKLKINIVANAI